MVQVISNLGSESTSFNSITVIRPVAVSAAFVVAILITCRTIIQPLIHWVKVEKVDLSSPLAHFLLLHRKTSTLVFHTSFLIGMVIGSIYAGTSNLFAAYLAGAVISWWDSELLRVQGTKHADIADRSHEVHEHESAEPGLTTSDSVQTMPNAGMKSEPEPSAIDTDVHQSRSDWSGISIYEEYYATVLQRVLKPFFFASIAFSIPITQMFTGTIIWRGLVYTILMFVGKMLTGLWLVRFSTPLSAVVTLLKPLERLGWHCWGSRKATIPGTPDVTKEHISCQVPGFRPEQTSQSHSHNEAVRLQKPLSLYPATILGTAMVSRGEIGFLIASVAESKGIFASSQRNDSSEVFLVVVWAITLCELSSLVILCPVLASRYVAKYSPRRCSCSISRKTLRS